MNRCRDPYTEYAAKLFAVPEGKVTADQRKQAKCALFRELYTPPMPFSFAPAKRDPKTQHMEQQVMDELNRIIKALREWGSGQEPLFDSIGLCGNLVHLCDLPGAVIDDLLPEAFRSWPNYSGNLGYPVPDPEAPSSKAAAYKIYYDRHDLWEDSPYGNLRRELCLHVADWLEANKSKVLPLFEEKFHD